MSKNISEIDKNFKIIFLYTYLKKEAMIVLFSLYSIAFSLDLRFIKLSLE